MTSPQASNRPAIDRLVAALDDINEPWTQSGRVLAERALAADPTIAADMELGRRIRDANDPLLDQALEVATWEEGREQGVDLHALRAALTEGEK